MAAAGPALAQADASQLSDEQMAEARQFVVDNALYITMHEAGHMLISELGLPVLGKEEDAVDNLASVIMLESDTDEFDQAIMDAAGGWFLMQNGQDITDSDLMDEHSLNDQRAYTIVCMATGAAPDYFAEFADEIEFPAERRDRCADEYQQAADSWEAVLADAELGEGQTPTRFDISYDPPSPENEAWAGLLREAQVLETVANLVSTYVKLDDGIRMVATNCGEENAFWSPEDRQLTFCYEFAGLYAAEIVNYFAEGGQG
ncbi:MAG: hypothetical protein H6873_03280 [Hyphomicrobiaceae bacterium]|nr:hypothetical protein [Hyphomicrobiaceae bacterium]